MLLFAELLIRCVSQTSTDNISVVSKPNPIFDSLLELSRWDDSNKLSKIGFGVEMTQILSVEVWFTHLISSSANKSIARACQQHWSGAVYEFSVK